jgi:RNA polymerase sigma-70 factor, ECF subfamily
LRVLERSTASRPAKLQALWEAWTPSLQGLAYRVTADYARAEEVVADAFIKLADDPVLERPDTEVVAWLRRVTFNGALNRVRDERRALHRLERAGRLDVTAQSNDPADEVVAAEDRARVRAVLATLSDRHHAVLLLRASGCSYAEIAEAVQCAPGSVGTLLARAERAFTAAYTTASSSKGRS